MRVNVDLGLEDVPGTLIRALEPISSLEGNIIGVVHHHDKVVGGRIIVNVIFEVSSQSRLEDLKGIWESRNVDIVTLGPFYETFPMEFLLVGNIPPGEVREITNGMELMKDLDSMDIRLTGSLASDGRTALVFGKMRTLHGIDRMEELLRKRGEDSGFIVIRGLED